MARRLGRRSLLQLSQLEDRSTPSVTVISQTPPPIGTTGGSLATDSDIADTDGTNPVTVSVLDNDSATTGFALIPSSVHLVSNPSHGFASVNAATGAITYTGTGFYMGTDTMQYTVHDTNGAVSAPTDLTIIINRPTANDDFDTTPVNTAIVEDVLANDTDPDGNNEIDPSKVQSVGGPSHGTLSIDPSNGKTTYTPAAGFVGTDSWQYTITDFAGAESSPGTVTILVTAAPSTPSAPVALDDVADTDGTNPVDVAVLANDSTSAGHTLDPATVSVINGPTHGTVAINPSTGVITYTGTGFFMGTDTFQYTVGDGDATSSPATVSIIIHRPTANDDFADTDGNNPVTVDVLGNDSDPDGNNQINPASVTLVGGPSRGSVTIDPTTGAMTYTATGFFEGTDSFQYTITDFPGAQSSPGTVTIVVHRPTANPDSALTTLGTAVIIPVLANDTDPDGNNQIDPSTVNVVGGPSHGTVQVNSTTGEATYTPNATFLGTDTFLYTITDFPGAVSSASEVRIKVEAAAGAQITAVGAGAGGGPAITVLNSDGTTKGSVFAFDPSFSGGVRVAVADITGDGIPDIIAVPGAGGGPVVEVFDGTDLKQVASFFAYDPSFRGGLTVAAGDVNGDGIPDIVTGTGVGGGPNVKVFSGANLSAIQSFFALDSSFRGGVNVAVGDVDGDGKADIATGAGVGGGPQVAIYSGADDSVLASYFAFDPNFRGGVSVALADTTGNTLPELVAAAGPGGGPRVVVIDPFTGNVNQSLFAFDPSFTGGVRLGATDANQDGHSDLIVGPGAGANLPVLTLSGDALTPLHSSDPFEDFLGGVYVGGPG